MRVPCLGLPQIRVASGNLVIFDTFCEFHCSGSARWCKVSSMQHNESRQSCCMASVAYSTIARHSLCGCSGVILGLDRGYFGIIEKKMDTTV